ncbi:energy-coupling factor transporter ATPase [Acidaminobacter sp. JC074]|uniref:energy-coupling factor transporter ATPase n=1 Tax=Acidaminobacter sp. JC074 TaxID=2530199 RepID=UPI001F0D90FC|nr:energy-coupling factor transporter ATPase [Acidaminobacter sp. JC074]MCH4890516.1 energy-coupling factor transporter ATPase [Acidaminobacter sp. JC074]
MIKANHLSFEYIRQDSITSVLEDFNIHVKDGEFVVIMGHNGSGKSTFAKLANAILQPKSGDLLINNLNTKEEKNIWDIREYAGLIFQNPDNQIVATIVEEDVAFGPENLGVKSDEIRKRVDDVLKIVDMDDYHKRPPHMLSGGQKQRIAIAGVLAMKPKCIILDEPTAMLDPSGRAEVLKIIKRLNKEEKMTVVLITHFMNEAIDADKIVVIDNGKIELSGTPREVFSNVDKMKEIGLDVPQVTSLAVALEKEGINIKKDIISIDEMVDSLCQLK